MKSVVLTLSYLKDVFNTMSNIYDKSKRSAIMSRISGKDTKPEIQVRKYLFANGFRYRKNVKDFIISPKI